jgi:hypothetical protein
MKHDHMPALNKYTSPNQYAALQEIDKTSSLITLLTQGKMGTTLGALIRNAWIDSETITDAEGVTSERWYVTDAGRHAMKMYEIKQVQEQKAAEARAEIQRIREVQKQQQLDLERDALNNLTSYFIHKLQCQQELSREWAAIIDRSSLMDGVKFANCVSIAKERAEATKKDGAWIRPQRERSDDW